MNSRRLRNSFIYLLITVAVIAVIMTLMSGSFGGGSEDISINEVVSMAARGNIDTLEVRGDAIMVTTRSGETFASRKESGSSIMEILQRADIDMVNPSFRLDVQGSSGLSSLFGVFIQFLPLIFFGALIIFMMRRAQGGANQTFNFGRSRARMFMGNSPQVSFSDVAGVEEAKEELQEVVEFLKFPERFLALGAKIPKGVLLVGPPGTGKTLMARAVAGEAGVPFFSISGSEFVEMFVGVGASRVRDLFDQAKRNAPCIIFVDEIDAVGRHRGAGLGGGHDEREQTLNQILVEMDGFATGTNIIIIAATNRPDILDPALLRPGRFDRRVVLDNPDLRGRKAILGVHSDGKPLDADVNLERVARQTVGFSGADLANLVNEAALLAARRAKTLISLSEFTESIDRVLLGPARKSRVITEREKRITAYHEAGHALVAHALPNADNPFKVTVVSRGQSGGHTRYLPEEDRNLWTRAQFEDMLAAALGGRVAEELVFDEITTGAGSDIQQATNIARQMVTRYGMSEKLGPRTFGKSEDMVFLGREISERRDYSDKVAETIDAEVHRIIDDAHKSANAVIAERMPELERIAEYLIENETIEVDELDRLWDDAPASGADDADADAPPAAQQDASENADGGDSPAEPRPKMAPAAPEPAGD